MLTTMLWHSTKHCPCAAKSNSSDSSIVRVNMGESSSSSYFARPGWSRSTFLELLFASWLGRSTPLERLFAAWLTHLQVLASTTLHERCPQACQKLTLRSTTRRFGKRFARYMLPVARKRTAFRKTSQPYQGVLVGWVYVRLAEQRQLLTGLLGLTHYQC